MMLGIVHKLAPGRPGGSKQWIWFLGFMAGFILLLLLLWLRMVTVRSTAFEAEEEKPPTPVRVINVEPQSAWKTVRFLARVEGGQTVQITPDVAGWVTMKKAVRGQSVKKGDPLIVLEDPRIELSLKEAQGRLGSARAKLREMERRLGQAEGLFEKGIVSRDEVDSLRNQTTAQRSDTSVFEVIYRRALWDFDRLTVRANISGRVIEIVPDIGQKVSPSDVVVRMVNSSQKRVVAGVDIKWARKIRPGHRVDVITDTSGGEVVVEGTVIGVSPDVDLKSGTYELEIGLEESYYELWPGEVVTIKVPLEELEDIVKVPRAAVLTNEEELFLFAYIDERAKQVPVDVIWLDDDVGAVPIEQLPEGAKVIVEGQAGLVNGEVVRVVN